MAKSKFIIVSYRCPECNKPGKTTKRGKKVLKEMSIYCNQCRAHTKQKPKDIKKPAKK